MREIWDHEEEIDILINRELWCIFKNLKIKVYVLPTDNKLSEIKNETDLDFLQMKVKKKLVIIL